MSISAALALTALLLLLNAFFVGAEFALVSARRSQIEPRAQEGSKVAGITLRAIEQVSSMMAGAQLGITICSVALGAVSEPAIARLLEPGFEALGVPHGLVHPIALVIALSIVVYLHVVLGEMVPKNIAIAGPDRAALVLGPPMYAIVVVLRPLIALFNAIANLTLRLIRIEPREEVNAAFTREQVAAMVEESRGQGLLAEEEAERLSGALGFPEKTVGAVLLPAQYIETVRRGATPAEVEARCAATGYSRFPVRAEDGEMVGYLHIKDALEPDPARRDQPLDAGWIRPFATVRIDEALPDVLTDLQRRGAHMAQVVDEDGTTLGLAALEDVIEELVGEIRDAAHLEESSTRSESR